MVQLQEGRWEKVVALKATVEGGGATAGGWYLLGGAKIGGRLRKVVQRDRWSKVDQRDRWRMVSGLGCLTSSQQDPRFSIGDPHPTLLLTGGG